MATGPAPLPSGREARDSVALRWLALLAFVALLPLAKPFLLPVVVALLLAVVLAGPVRRLQKRGIAEPIGAAIVVGAAASAVIGIGLALAGPASEWMERAPYNMNQLLRSFDRLREAFPLLNVATAGNGDSTVEGGGIGEKIASEGWNITRLVLGQVTGFAVSTAATVILLYFLLASEHYLVIRLMQQMPGRRARLHWLAMGRSVQREVAHYLSTMTIVNVMLGVGTGLALWAIGLPNPLLWGTITAVLNFVPYLGPLVIGALLLMAGVLQFDDFGYMIAPPLIFFALNIVETYIVSPLLMGKRLDLNPVFVFLSVMFWGWVWGVAGALVAVPVLVALRNAARHSRGWRHVCYWLEKPAETSKTIRGLVRASEQRSTWSQRWRWRERIAPVPMAPPPAVVPPAPPPAAFQPEVAVVEPKFAPDRREPALPAQ